MRLHRALTARELIIRWEQDGFDTPSFDHIGLARPRASLHVREQGGGKLHDGIMTVSCDGRLARGGLRGIVVF